MLLPFTIQSILTNLQIFNFFQLANKMAVSTFKPVGEVNIDFRANTQFSAIQRPTMADINKCGMKIKVPEKTKAPENHKLLIWSVANRKQEYQKTIDKFMTESRFREPSSLSSGCEWEIARESSPLAVWKLCQNEYMVPFSITETRSTNQNF